MKRAAAVTAALLASVLVLAGCGSSDDQLVTGFSGPDKHGYQGTYLTNPFPVVDVALTDTAGDPLTLSKAAQPLKIAFYGYTNCPDICTIMMSTIASAMTRLDAAQRAQVGVYFITTDPARDTGPVLRAYLDRFNPDFGGLTGKLTDIEAQGEPMKVFLAKGRKLPSGGYEVDHTSYVFGIQGDDTRIFWNQGTSPSAMATDIIKLLKS